MRKSAFSTILLGGVVLFTGMATATERHVPSQYATIQAAINACNSGDIVIVAPGTYTGAGNRDIDFLGKAITVRSTDPNDSGVVAATVIDCENNIGHRGFYFHSGEGADSIVSGLTITRGKITGNPANGGGIYCSESSPTIENCIITNNIVYGYYNHGYGGAIACKSSNTEIVNCTINGNTAVGGDGWLIFPGASPGANGYGGGIYLSTDSNVTIENCAIYNNTAKGGKGNDGDCVESWPADGGNGLGGGIYTKSSSGSIKNCLIYSNECRGGPGGVNVCGSGFVGNCYGGGVYGGVDVISCTITDNQLYGTLKDGGGFYCTAVSLINNSILWNNNDEEIYSFGSVPIVSYSNIQGGWTGTGNTDTDPLFANPGNGDYHLKSQAGRWNPNSQSWVTDAVTSLCIDAGDPNSDWTVELWPHGKRINMGAYGGTPQASMSLSTVGNIANLNNDPCDAINFNDLSLFIEKWLYEEVLLPEDLNRNGIVNFVDYAIFAQQWLYTPAEPGIEFEISPCEGWGMSATESEPLDQTRFTVTVEGRYIHFEDMMVANCCAKELWLEMTVENHLITVYEKEEGGFCLCICDYPVTATLGPFEPGTYTFEVYADFGGFVGSTTVNIE